MLDISKDIHSLSAFKRSTTDFLRRMKESGHPVVLTINGKAEIVVQDAGSYQRLLDLLDRLEAIEGIRAGLRSVSAGRTRPAKQALDGIRRKHAIPR